jgi:hypothetical protein
MDGIRLRWGCTDRPRRPGAAMAREKLTIERIRRFNCPDGVRQAFAWGTGSLLAVRATRGSRAFLCQSELAGAPIRVAIGDVTAWLLDDPRAEARRLRTLADQQIDPRQERANRIAAVEARRRADAAEERTAGRGAAPAKRSASCHRPTAPMAVLSRSPTAQVTSDPLRPPAEIRRPLGSIEAPRGRGAAAPGPCRGRHARRGR